MNAMIVHHAKFGIGQIVQHRSYPFRGVVFDVDPEFASAEDLWLAIPEQDRPRKDQPYYHLLAEGEGRSYLAYVSEQNLVPDHTGRPVSHPETEVIFAGFDHGQYRQYQRPMN